MNGKREVLERILDEIDSKIGLATFFNRLNDNASLRSLFLLHPQELFITEDKISLPILVWSSDVSDSKPNNKTVLSIFRDIALARYENAVKQFPFMGAKGQPKELLDVLIYGAFLLARTKPKVKELITGEFSFKKMQDVLGENYEKLGQMNDGILNNSSDPTMRHLIKIFENWDRQWASK